LNVVNDEALFKRVVGQILNLLKTHFPNESSNFLNSGNPYLKNIIDNKNTILIDNAIILPALTDKEKDLMKLNEELDIILNKIYTKNKILTLNLDETLEIQKILREFRLKNYKNLTQEQKNIISTAGKKLSDYKLKTLRIKPK
jgi:hypothetical protein